MLGLELFNLTKEIDYMALALFTSQQPVDDFGLGANSLKFSAFLDGGTDTQFVVPGDAPYYKALMISTPADQVWFALNEVAELPAGGSIIETTSELIKASCGTCRLVSAGDILHFITSTSDAPLSILLYAVV